MFNSTRPEEFRLQSRLLHQLRRLIGCIITPLTCLLPLVEPMRASQYRQARATVGPDEADGVETTAVTAPATTFHRFWEFPAELRHKIIKHALFPTKKSFEVAMEKIRLSPLFHVSKSIRGEAIRAYRENVTVTAYVVMRHSYMDVLRPEYRNAFRNLNKAAVLKHKVRHLDVQGPLSVLTFANILLFVSDIDQCRLFNMGIRVGRNGEGYEVEPYLNVLPSSATRLGWLEIAAVERLPVDWKPQMNEMLDLSGGRGFDTREIETLAGMLHICYDKAKFAPEPRLVSFGGDDIKGHYWKETKIDTTIDPVENFGCPRTAGGRSSVLASDEMQELDESAQESAEESADDGVIDLEGDGPDDEEGEVMMEDEADEEMEDEEEDDDELIHEAIPASFLSSDIDMPQLPEPKFSNLEGDLAMSDLFH